MYSKIHSIYINRKDHKLSKWILSEGIYLESDRQRKYPLLQPFGRLFSMCTYMYMYILSKGQYVFLIFPPVVNVK